MPRTPRLARLVVFGLVASACGSPPGRAQVPAATDQPPPAAPAADEAIRSIIPSPPAAIPDDPPPHEGAMIDVPLTIDPPDIIIVEVLEALPGRPITGERLVRPDGTVSLGFYGDVHVRGLTPEQAKVKILLHLRSFLTDDVLGLRRFEPPGYTGVEPLAKPGTRVPFRMEIDPDNRPFEKPDVQPKPESPAPIETPLDPSQPRPTAGRFGDRPWSRTQFNPSRVDRRTTARPRLVKQGRDPVQAPMAQEREQGDQLLEGEAVYVDPARSDRVFVDIASLNSKIYYVQGDVGSPGRLPATGKETILDAINYGGGLIPTAEPADIHLHRPARGGKPAKDYPIDYAAIQRGDARANLQLFPDDRIVVGRNAIVKKTIEIDRAAAPLSSVSNAALQQFLTLRTMDGISGGVEAARNQVLKGWFDFLWNLPVGRSTEFGPAQLLDAIQRRLDPPAAAQPAPK